MESILATDWDERLAGSKSRDRELGSFTDYSHLRVKLRRAGTPFGVQVRHGRFVLWRTRRSESVR